MTNIRRDAMANLERGREGRAQADPRGAGRPRRPRPPHGPERTFVKKWTLDELVPMVETGLKGRDYDRGRAMFAAAKCFSCHRFNNEGGGLGPDLSGVAGRFSARDLLESIVVPSKTISDQYEAVMIATTDGRVVTGRIVNLNGDNLMINPDMLDPNQHGQRPARRDRGDEAVAGLDDARGAARHAGPGRGPRPGRVPALARRSRKPDVSPKHRPGIEERRSLCGWGIRGVLQWQGSRGLGRESGILERSRRMPHRQGAGRGPEIQHISVRQDALQGFRADLPVPAQGRERQQRRAVPQPDRRRPDVRGRRPARRRSASPSGAACTASATRAAG